MRKHWEKGRIELESLAHQCGILPSYMAANGETRLVATETLQALLGLFGVSAESRSEVVQSLRTLQSKRPSIDPVVLCDRNTPFVSIRIEGQLSGKRIQCRLRSEDGEYSRTEILTPRRGKDGKYTLDFPLRNITEGYHQLEIETRSGRATALLICSPCRAYRPPTRRRQWGVFAPAYALRSNTNWGSGDFHDLRNFGRWIAEAGGSLIGTLPLTATFFDHSFDPSPYSPASRLFWNEFYLHIPDIPEFALCKAAQLIVSSKDFSQKVTALRKSQTVDYRHEMRLKRQVLEELAEYFFREPSPRRDAFDRFLKARPELIHYARFRAVMEQRGEHWGAWPKRLRRGIVQTKDFQQKSEQYYLYTQWNAEQQVATLSETFRAANVSFYLDVPLGVSGHSFDAWQYQQLFVTGATVGAPPDIFFTRGQDWGLAPLHPGTIRENQYRYYREFVRFQMRYASVLRLDHVMGLHRLYWIPRGFPASEGAFVRYPAEEFYAILSLESRRHQTVLVGENLGTVPPEVNRSLAHHGVDEMYVLQYEPRDNSKETLRTPPRNSVASLNTHDMPTFAAFWNALDIADRLKLGLLPKRDLPAAKAQRRRLKTALVRFLQRKGCLAVKRHSSAAAVFCACAAYLGKSNAALVLLNLEDLWSETQSQNTPGTTSERENWVRKIRYSLAQIKKSKRLQRLLKAIGDERNRRSLRSSRSRNHSRSAAPRRGNRRRKAATKPRSALLDINSTGEYPLAQAQ